MSKEASPPVVIDPLEALENLEPDMPIEQRWLNLQPLHIRAWHAIRQNKFARTAVGYAASLLSGVVARDGFQTWQNFATSLKDSLVERVMGLTGVDTGPTTVKHLLPESASHVLFVATTAYFLGGEAVDQWLYSRDVKRGLAYVPISKNKLSEALRGKAWKDHTVVIDPYRLLFDSLSTANPNTQMVLVHGGDSRVADTDGALKGETLGPQDLRRHVNAFGEDHLSDAAVLARARPEDAKRIIINLWRPDNALYSSVFAPADTNAIYSVAKVDNIIRTMGSMGVEAPVEVILPQGEQWQFGDAKRLFEGDSHGKMKVHVVTPEQKIIGELGRKLGEVGIHGKDQVYVVSDTKTVENGKDVALKDVFESDIRENGITVADNEKDAQVIIIYCSTDDVSNARAAQLVRKYPDKKVIVMIEHTSNADEAKNSGASAWYLPGIISSSL